MRQEDLCPGYADPIPVSKKALKKAVFRPGSFWSGHHYTGIKRIKIKCKMCGTRVTSSITCCMDGCCVRHVIPPHKPKR